MTIGACNGGDRGNTKDRRARREWLVKTYRADVDLLRVEWTTPHEVTVDRFLISADELRQFDNVASVEVVPTCRCFRCGKLLTVDTVTPDRIVPGAKKTAEYPKGGTYVRKNIRPACSTCQSITGNEIKASLKKVR